MRLPSRLLVTTAATLSMAALPLSAADMTVSDLRLGFGVLSEEFKGESSTTFSDQGGNTISTSSDDDSRDSDYNLRVQLQYVAGSLGSGGGLIWGVGVAVNNATWDDAGQDAHITTPVINVMLGYGYAFTPNWHAEVTPFAGYGRGYFSVTSDGSTDTSEEWVDYLEYGIKLGTYVRLGEGLVLGVEVPYLVGRFDPEYDYTDNDHHEVTVSDEQRNQGFGLLVSLGYRF